MDEGDRPSVRGTEPEHSSQPKVGAEGNAGKSILGRPARCSWSNFGKHGWIGDGGIRRRLDLQRRPANHLLTRIIVALALDSVRCFSSLTIWAWFRKSTAVFTA
jgi:hypothetical protein